MRRPVAGVAAAWAVAVAAVVIPSVVAVPARGAARVDAAKVCPAFVGPKWFFAAGNTGTKYQLETSGGYPCATAQTWAKKLAARTLPSRKQNVHYTIQGPAGFRCTASPDKHGHAYTGSCDKPVKGSVTMIGFDWTSSFF